MYERIGDRKWMNRSIEDEIRIFKEVKANLIFRAFWRWNPCPERCEDLADREAKRDLHAQGIQLLPSRGNYIEDKERNPRHNDLRGGSFSDSPQKC